MMALDYFLYDNCTWSARWGRDWGLKAATGVLAGRHDLKEWFDRYCGLLPSAQGQLRDFGEAIGGVRPPDRKGYLVCVTLECSDSFGRPSWAVIGLWCPDPATLMKLLCCDLFPAARGLIGSEALPDTVEVPANRADLPQPLRRTSTEPAFHRFQGRATVQEVLALLLGALQRKALLPNVLGITATARFAAVQQAGFEVAYCHPMNEQAELALDRILSPPDTVEEELPPPIRVALRHPGRRAPGIAPNPRPVEEKSWSPFSFLLSGVAVALLLVAVFLIWGDDVPDVAQDIDGPAPLLEAGSGTQEGVPAAAADFEVLKKVESHLVEIKDLEEKDLLDSAAFQAAATLEVLPEHEEERRRVRKAFENLLAIQDQMVGRQGVAYYYEEEGKDLEPALRAQKITSILHKAPLGQEDCAVLKRAFGFEFEDPHSIVSRWCVALEKLEDTAASLQPAVREEPAGK
jgi:hypothetical protein